MASWAIWSRLVTLDSTCGGLSLLSAASRGREDAPTSSRPRPGSSTVEFVSCWYSRDATHGPVCSYLSMALVDSTPELSHVVGARWLAQLAAAKVGCASPSQQQQQQASCIFPCSRPRPPHNPCTARLSPDILIGPVDKPLLCLPEYSHPRVIPTAIPKILNFHLHYLQRRVEISLRSVNGSLSSLTLPSPPRIASAFSSGIA